MSKRIDWTRMTWRMQWTLFLLIAALLVIAAGYASAQQTGGKDVSPAAKANIPQEEGTQASSAKCYTLAEKEAYQQNVASDLDEMQQKIDELKIKSRTIVQQKKRMMIKTLIDLQNMEDAARRRLADLKSASDNDWDRLKGEMDEAMSDLNSAYQEVAAHF